MNLTRSYHQPLLFASKQLEKAREAAFAWANEKLQTDHCHLHPDFHLYQVEGKNGKHLQANINALLSDIALPPFQATCSVYLIDEADKMLPSASNALLKTLEEPPQGACLALISANPAELLPTISSRCQPIILQADQQQTPQNSLTPYFDLAEKGQWPQLLQELGSFDAPDQETFLHELLDQARRHSTHTQKILYLIRLSKKALEHHLKPRTVLIHFLLQLFP